MIPFEDFFFAGSLVCDGGDAGTTGRGFFVSNRLSTRPDASGAAGVVSGKTTVGFGGAWVGADVGGNGSGVAGGGVVLGVSVATGNGSGSGGSEEGAVGMPVFWAASSIIFCEASNMSFGTKK